MNEMEIICYSCGRGENPENTLEGIKHCQEVAPDWRIEMDIQITADQHLVLFHDYGTKRTTGIDKQIFELNLNEVKKLNAGYNFENGNGFEYRTSLIEVPTLKQVFTKFPQAKLLLDIHTNNPEAVEILINLIASDFASGDFIIVSEYDGIIEELKQRRPNWRYGVPANEAKKMVYSSFLFLDNLFPIKSDILMLPQKFGNINVLTKRVVKHAKKRDKSIWAWIYEGEYVQTIETKTEMEGLAKLGVDGVFSEFPEKLSKEIM